MRQSAASALRPLQCQPPIILRLGPAKLQRARVAASHVICWITSSAVANSVSGMVRPSVLAVLRLMTSVPRLTLRR
jgi:hypothetical protein